jgi:hypothetical protein
MTRKLALVALLSLLAIAGCGKYGKPVRTSAAPPSGVSTQPSAATPAGEACEEDAEKAAP